MKVKKTIGILGGMGPEATNNLYSEIIANTPANKDQDHIPTIIFSNPLIPDRTDAILQKGRNPLPELLSSAKKLEKWGADFVIIPCNTSHFFISNLRAHLNIPIVSMLEETVLYVKSEFSMIKKVGLLATTGTIQSRIYHDVFSNANIEIIHLDQDDQEELVMKAIYGPSGIKSGDKDNSKKFLLKAVSLLKEKAVEIIIMGCSEIPLVLKQKGVPLLVNPTNILAKKAVLLALSN